MLTRSAKLGIIRPQLPDLPADVGTAPVIEDAELAGRCARTQVVDGISHTDLVDGK